MGYRRLFIIRKDLELTPENEDGTTTVGIWFCPLPDEKAHAISKKYHLYV